MKRRKILVWVIILSLLLPNFTMPAYAAEMETEVEESVAEEITTELLEESTVETVASEEFTTEEMLESTTEEECVEEVTSEVVEEVSVVETTESESVLETVVETTEVIEGEENFEDVQSYGSWYWPVPGYTSLSQIYHSGHKAVDIPAPLGTPICAAKAGTIRLVINDCDHVKLSNRGECVHYVNGYPYTDGGNQVYITHDDGTFSVYAHMIKGSISVTAGQRVSAGQQIGQMGQSGLATGVHLHFGVSAGGTTYYNGTIIDPMTLSYDSGGGSAASLLTNTGVTDITDTTAKINSTLPGIYNISEAGFYYGTSTDNMTKVVEATSGNVQTAFYTLGDGKWCGPLSPGTTYYYRIYVIINGVTHMSAIDSFTTTGTSYNDPIGNLDYMTGMTGQVYMNGWALDKDLPTTPLDIHVYIGSGNERKCYAIFNANIYREDVANAYPGVGANHGFEYTINTDLSGYQNVDVFAINIGGGTNNTCIGSGTVYITPDTSAPTIDKVWYSDITNHTFTVNASASDDIGVTRVRFPTWRADQTGEQAIWFEGTQRADGSWYAVIDAGNWGCVEATYYTHVYAYDAANNYSINENLSHWLDRTGPGGYGVETERISESTIKISCYAEDYAGEVDRVVFPTWTNYNGQDDIEADWYNKCKGTKEGDKWVWYVNDSDHNYEKGTYTTDIYAYDTVGNSSFIGGCVYSFENRYQPTKFTYSDHTYELYNDLLTWEEAKAKCESLGGHLVTINSQEEQNAIVEALSEGKREGYFIGGKTVGGGSTWITDEEFVYSNWYPGEPNNGREGTEDVYQIYLNGYWNDCQSNKPGIGFICEYEPDAVIPDDIPDETIPEGLWIAGIDENGYTYTGKAIKPEVRVYDHDTRLQAGKDYTITYKNNKKANDASDAKTAPTIIVKGKGNYSSQETATFKIMPKSISDSDISVDSIVLKYNKKIQKPIPVVKRDGKKLKNKADFTVQYVELAEGNIGANKNPGTYTIRITGKGGYTGSRDVTFTITENKLMSKMTVSKIPDQRYTGSAITPAVTVKNGKTTLTVDTDYTVSYQNNTEVGTATILITGRGSYSGEKKVAFKIKGISLSKATVTGIPNSVTYTGNAITTETSAWGNKPVLNIAVDGENKTLTEGTDYTISYQKNVNAGTASIIFKGINGYTGTLKKNFKITAYDITVDPLGNVSSTVDASVVYEKGGSRPKPVVRFGNSVLAEGKDYMLTYANNTRVNDGSDPGRIPYVTIKGKGNYKGTRSLAFKITVRSMEGLTISAPDKVYKDQKNAYKTTPKITDLNGKVLKAGTDYEKAYLYTYKNEVMLADGTVRSAGSEVGSTDIVPAGTVLIISVQGKGNYSDDYLQGEYRIVKSNISKAKVKVESQIYTGSQIEPGKEDITIKIGKTTLSSLDYEIIGYSNNIKKGNAKLTIKGVGNYGGTKTVTFKIKSKGFLWWWR